MTNEEFLTAAFAETPPDARPHICSFHGDPNEAGIRWAGMPWIPGGTIVKPVFGFQPFGPAMNNYVAISSFRNGYRRKADFAAMHLLMVDDVGTKVPASAIKLPTFARVETSPGNFQVWYRFSPPIDNLDIGAALINTMIKKGLTKDAKDPGMRGVTRYGRLPVGRNMKPEYGPSGAPVNLKEYVPERVTTLREFVKIYGLTLSPQRPKPHPKRPNKLPPRIALTLDVIVALDMYRSAAGNGYHAIRCPWVHEHTKRAESGTYYSEPSADNYWRGGFKCNHGHGDRLHIGDLLTYLDAKRKEVS